MSRTEYEVYAIRYATRNGHRSEAFIDGDPENPPMTMDYFIWAARSKERVFVIDGGFTKQVAEKRKRTFLRCPIDTLKLVGIDPETVKDVIVTHLHNDHSGNFDRFPKARFHLQEREMRYVTGAHMRDHVISRPFEIDDILTVVRMNFEGRVELYRSDAELADGVSIHLTGGHSDGLQFVRVWTRKGWLVVASDVAHYYDNLELRRPVRVIFNVGDALDGFRAVERLASSRDLIVPGHDPLVMKNFPPAAPGLEGAVVRLD